MTRKTRIHLPANTAGPFTLSVRISISLHTAPKGSHPKKGILLKIFQKWPRPFWIGPESPSPLLENVQEGVTCSGTL